MYKLCIESRIIIHRKDDLLKETTGVLDVIN
jgi:hypothetical protein